MRYSLLLACMGALGLCGCATPRSVLPEAPEAWWVQVWVGTPKSVFWVEVDSEGAGKFWASADDDTISEGDFTATIEASRHIYESVRRLFSDYTIRDGPVATVEGISKKMTDDPFYTVSFTARVGQQQLSFDTPFLKSLDDYTNLRPIVVESAALLPDGTRTRIDLGGTGGAGEILGKSDASSGAAGRF